MTSVTDAQEIGVKIISTNGYDNCIEISNPAARAVIEPNCGGRVLYYEVNGKNILYIDPRHDGWTWDEDPNNSFPYYGGPCGGRFDIGPEMIAPQRPVLFLGKWDFEILGSRTVRLTSKEDQNTGIQLVRTFELNGYSSELVCTQKMINISNEDKKYYYWSRTFAVGKGICLVPVPEYSRFPKKYILYDEDQRLDFDPEPETAISLENDILKISSTPSRPKIAIDTDKDWLAYLSRNNLLFIKNFPIYPDRAYGDLVGNPVSIWYYKEQVCEIEPTSPIVNLAPGESHSFTERWNLVEYNYPADVEINYSEILRIIETYRK